jgi:hypothetical protein
MAHGNTISYPIPLLSPSEPTDPAWPSWGLRGDSKHPTTPSSSSSTLHEPDEPHESHWSLSNWEHHSEDFRIDASWENEGTESLISVGSEELDARSYTTEEEEGEEETLEHPFSMGLFGGDSSTTTHHITFMPQDPWTPPSTPPPSTKRERDSPLAPSRPPKSPLRKSPTTPDLRSTMALQAERTIFPRKDKEEEEEEEDEEFEMLCSKENWTSLRQYCRRSI